MAACTVPERNISEDLEEVVYKPLKDDLSNVLVRDENQPKNDAPFLYFAAFAACLTMSAVGCVFIWTSPVLSKLKSTDTEINPLGRPITLYEESLIACLPSVGGAIGPLMLGKLSDIIGRRKSLMCISALMLISNVTLAFAKKLYFYYLARFLLGIGFGGILMILPIFVSEISEDHNRGKFGTLLGFFLTVGSLYGYVLGPMFHVREFTLLCTVPLVLSLFCFTFFIPDTPSFLASKGDRTGAKHALKKFRNATSSNLENLLQEIEHVLKESSKSSQGGIAAVLKSEFLKKGLIISVGTGVFQQLSGVPALLGFIGPVFDSAGSGLSGNMSAILIGVVQLFSFILAFFIMGRLGRRVVLLSSQILITAFLLILGIYFYLKNLNIVFIDNFFWLPIVCVMFCVVGFAIGLGPIPMILMSELFSNDVKSVAAAVTTFICAAASFVAVFSFPLILEFLGASWCFCLFSGVTLLGTIFTYFAVPETRGKNILEIQKILKS